MAQNHLSAGRSGAAGKDCFQVGRVGYVAGTARPWGFHSLDLQEPAVNLRKKCCNDGRIHAKQSCATGVSFMLQTMSTLSNSIHNKVAQRTATLAEVLFDGFAKEAVQDGDDFLKETGNVIAKWLKSHREGNMTQKNFESLVRGEKHHAKLLALKEAGVDEVAITVFLDAFLQVVINAALAEGEWRQMV
jgi:hypothetical protein